MYVCLCFPTTEKELNKLAKESKTFDEFLKKTEVGSGCKTCECDRRYLKKVFDKQQVQERNNDFDNKSVDKT